jgi:hypothetical protein
MKKLTIIISLFVLALNINAQIIYTNPEPEKIASLGHPVSIDIEAATQIWGRGLSFYVSALEGSYTQGADSIRFYGTLWNCNFVRKPGVGDPDNLIWGETINAESTWQWPSPYDFNDGSLAVLQGENISGTWTDSEIAFFGMRFFTFQGDTIYGWIRLKVNITEKTIQLYDYAFNLTPNEGIFAGEGIPFLVTDIEVSDVTNFHDERDISLSFKIPPGDTGMDEYRVFIVPSAIASGFGIDQAESVSAGNYMQILPTGLDFLGRIESGTKDIEGNSVVESAPYKIFILSVPSIGISGGNQLSEPSEEISLSNVLVPPVIYTNPEPDIILDGSSGSFTQQIIDFDNDGFGNLEFNFRGVGYMDGTYYYDFEIMTVTSPWKSSNVEYGTILDSNTSFHWGDGAICSMQGSQYQGWSSSNPLIDKFIGFSITQGIETLYGWVRVSTDCSTRKLFIKDYAYAEGGLPIFAGQGITLIPENITVADNSDFHNSKDIQLSFTKAYLEEYMIEYRAIIVPAESAESFTLEMAESLSPDKYYSITPNGLDFSNILPDDLADANGNTITETVPYKVFIFGIAEQASIFANALSAPIGITIFTTVDSVSNLIISSEYNGGNDYTLSIDFDTPLNESGILEYRSFIVPENLVSGFDTTLAASVIADNYIVFETNFPSSHISASLNRSEVRDINGNMPSYNNIYKIVVMSVTNWNTTNRNNLLISDSTVSFFTPCSAPDSVYVLDIGDVGNPADIEVNFKTLVDESLISGYRIFILAESEDDGFNLLEAESAPEGNYYDIATSGTPGENFSVVLPANSVQFNGNAIVPDQAYLVYVMAVANNLTSDFNALSVPSSRFIYGTPEYFYTGKTFGENIEYINPEPDLFSGVYCDGIFYELDLNHDYVNDLKFELNSSASPSHTETSVYVRTLNSASILDTISSRVEGYYYLNNQVAWKSGNLLLQRAGGNPMAPWSSTGLWNDAGPGFIAVKILTPNDTVYAWIRLQIHADIAASLTIYDYALLGEYLSVEENQISVSAIYPNPSNGNFTISFEEYAEPIDFEITDITGRAVYKGIITSQNTEVNLSGCSKGMYFVRSSDEKSVAKKIVIQ